MIICVPYVVLEVVLCVKYNCPHYFLRDMHLLHVSLLKPVNEVIDVKVKDVITKLPKITTIQRQSVHTEIAVLELHWVLVQGQVNESH